ncbi:hypothetical protein E4Q23_21080, partial [Candidatus Accumulibacter phosphatis]
MREIARQRESAEIIQLPLWPEPKRGTPNSFIRSALFSAIQSKDRQFIDGKTLDSQAGITIKYTGQQLNQEDLTLWETLVHLAKGHPLGNVCSFTAHGLLKAMCLEPRAYVSRTPCLWRGVCATSWAKTATKQQHDGAAAPQMCLEPRA